MRTRLSIFVSRKRNDYVCIQGFLFLFLGNVAGIKQPRPYFLSLSIHLSFHCDSAERIKATDALQMIMQIGLQIESHYNEPER
jgi:hypothetical protein